MRKFYFYFLFLLIAMGCQPNPSRSDKDQNDETTEAKKQSKPYILKKNEGETLIDGRGRTLIIKASPETGFAHITMGTEHHPIGAGTLIHKHDHTEEILFVHKGKGMAIVNGDTIDIEEGTTLVIPPGTWHGIENPKDSMDILFMVTPQGLEKLFRGIGAPPGVQIKELTKEQMDSIEIVADSKLPKKN